jgi:hypothetical protein
VVISICILVFSSIGLAIHLLSLIHNWSLRHVSLADRASSSQFSRAYRVRGFFHFLRVIWICVGFAYVFTSKVPANNNCEILRFYLGIVCFNTLVLLFIWSPKPSLPVRRSLFLECFILLLSLIFNSLYFGFVIFAMLKIQASECIYTRIEDLYFHAPLKSFAFVGLILIGCVVSSNIFGAIVNHLFYRLPNMRRVFVRLAAIHYVIAYLITVVVVYYFSVGAVLLFRPRSGSTCRIVAPHLHKTLFIWQIIRVFLPLILWPLALLVCCLGVIFGTCLAECLPAWIAVPLHAWIRVCCV